MMFRTRYGFTIVELLVVVTIIVILLAMLSPALSKALYQAQLTQCGGNIRSVISGMHSYAFGAKRYYPYRGLPATKNQFPIQPQVLTHPTEGVNGPATYDIRPPLKGFISINAQLNDPLTQPVNLEWGITEGLADTYILASYHLWHGWKQPNGKGMYKIGDRWTWTNRGYSVLMSDMDLRWSSGQDTVFTSSHPDSGLMFNNVAERAFSPFTTFITVSAWEAYGFATRLPLELNYGYDDGSVQRLAQVKYVDDRMDRVSHRSDGSSGGGTGAQVPKQ